MAYSEKVVDHFTNPKNVGSLDKNDVNVGTGLVGAPECGDVMKLQIKVDDNQNIIDAKFKTFGCIGSNSPIATPNGFKNISTLSVGEEIWAWNGKEVVKNTISKIKTKEVDYRDLLRIVFEKGRQPIICSKDHIWWGSDNKPIGAIDLEAGKELLEITENSIPEVTKFIHNGFKIKKISPIEDKRQLRGQERNGDLVKLYDLSLKEGANIFFVHRAMSHNCGSAIAASSLATEWVKDRHVDAAMEVNNTEIVEELSLPPVKIHCSVLAEDAIKAAIADYKQKQEGIGP